MAINRESRCAWPILASMPFLNATAAEITSRIAAAASEAAGFAVAVRVGEELRDHRNIGVDLPRARTAREGRLLRLRVAAALENMRIILAPHALAPRVGGTIEGSVRVRAPVGSTTCGDASHLCSGASPRQL